jgi:murein L,D-transpeptidase YafK
LTLAALNFQLRKEVHAIDDKLTIATSETIIDSRNVSMSEDGFWDGPVLYHEPANRPIHLILVKKSTQTLQLVRYDGKYQRIGNYFCATGENKGKKRREKDEKTPEGIYFNNKTFRDDEITVFGDRAFGLNYPDIFDNLSGNRGSGIFLHGSNRPVTAYSTNGCLALNNRDLADLDNQVNIKHTPFIIGEHLPYRYGAVKRDLSELIPFLKQSFLPDKYAGMPAEYDELTVLEFEDRIVARAQIRINSDDEIHGTSRIYLSGPGETLLVLVKREWEEERRKILFADKATSGNTSIRLASNKPTEEEKRLIDRVESWRRAWEQKQLNEYVDHYHPEFVSKGKDILQWKAYKGALNKRNRSISVKISGVRVGIEGQTARVYFRQNYRSDTFKSRSYKILEFKKQDGIWKIFRENSSIRKPPG